MELNSILDKIRKLIAVADDPNTVPEMAENYRAKAEQLMRDYRVEQEHLIAEDPTAVLPQVMRVVLAPNTSPYWQDYVNLWYYCAMHSEVRSQVLWEYPTDRSGRWAVATVVGYESDIRYAEYLFTAAQAVFSERIEPAIKPELSDAENIYRLRSSGIERRRVANMLWGLDTHASHAKVGKVYKEQCALRGEKPALDGRGVSAKTFREVYAREFTYEFERRLRRARDGADSMSGALVLKGRKERVDEAFYEQFPHLRPAPPGAMEKAEPCEDCKKTKHDSKKCHLHRPRKFTKADRDRYNRMYNSAAAVAGSAAGASAASEVEIVRGTQPAGRLGEDNLRKTVRDVTGWEINK